MCFPCASISRTRISPASSTTPTSSSSSSGADGFHQAARHRHQSLANPEQGEAPVFVVRRVEIDYLKPGRLDDLLEVVTHCAEIGGASLALAAGGARGETVLVRAKVVVVLVSGRRQTAADRARSSVTRFNDSLTKRLQRGNAGKAWYAGRARARDLG